MRLCKNKFFIPSLLFIMSFVLRLSLVFKGAYHCDCLELALAAKELIINQKFAYLHGTGYPLALIIEAFFVMLARGFHVYDPVIVINFVNVCVSSLCISLLFTLTKRIFSLKTALLSAIIFSINPISLYVSSYGNSHWFSIFFIITGLIVLINYLELHKRKYLFISAIIFGLAGGTRFPDLLMAIVPIAFLFLSGIIQSSEEISLFNKIGQFILFLFGIVLTTSVFYFPFLIQQRMWSNGSFFQHDVIDVIQMFSIRHIIDLTKYIGNSLTIPGCVATLVGLRMISQKNRKIFIVFALFIFLPILSIGGIPYVKTRHFLISILFAIVCQGYCLANLRKDKPKTNLILYVTFLSIIGLQLFVTFIQLRVHHNTDIIGDYFRWTGKQTKPNAYIIDVDHRVFIKYYSNRDSLGAPNQGLLDQSDQISFKNKLDSMLENNIPIYINSTGLSAYPAPYNFDTFMKKNYDLKYIGEERSSDWHQEMIRPVIFMNKLYEINKKKHEGNILEGQ